MPSAIAASDISANKVDTIVNDTLGDGKAQAGDTIKYDITITNNSATDPALNVTLNDIIDGNTTLVPNSINAQPQARNDAYTTVGNTLLKVGVAAGTDPEVVVAGSVFDNDANATGTSSYVSNTQPANGTVTFNANGTFTYLPNANFRGPTDTFTYTVRSDADNTLTDTATVTITITSMVWYVNNAAAAAGDGRSSSPFNAITATNINGAGGAGDQDVAGDYIYLFEGTGSYTTGLVLENTQVLYGSGVALVVPINATPTTLRAAGTRPTLSNGTGNALTLANSVLAQGLNLSAAANAALFGSGISGGSNVSDMNITTTGSGTAVSLANQAGTFNYSGGGGSSISGNSTGTAVLISGGGGNITFFGVPVSQNNGRAVDIQTRTGGTVSFENGSTVTQTAGSTDAVVLRNNTGGSVINFLNSVNLTTNAGRGLYTDNSTGSFTLNMNAAGNNINATGGAAIDVEDIAADLDFVNLTSTNSVAVGIRIVNLSNTPAGRSVTVTGTTTVTNSVATGVAVHSNAAAVTFATLNSAPATGQIALIVDSNSGTTTATGGTITASDAIAISVLNSPVNMTLGSVSTDNTGDSDPGVSLNGMTGSLVMSGGSLVGGNAQAFFANAQNGNITYNGTISQANAFRLIEVTNKTGGTVNFGGALTATAGTGISLTGNANTTMNFTAGMSLSTGANAAFTATGGGTVNATQNNSTILNTISTTTGNAVQIASGTNIGGSGVTFRSINVNNGASASAGNAIILNGTTGAFTVSGDGSQTGGFFDRDGSGGTLNRTTGHSVLLTNASNVTLRQMNFTNNGVNFDFVNSTGGSNIVLSAILMQNLGNHGWLASNLGGTSAFNHNGRIETWNTNNSNGIEVVNTNTNFTSFTVDRTVFTTSATGSSGFLFSCDGTTTGGTVNLTNSEFTLIDQNAAQLNNNGSGTNTFVVQRNNFHDADNTGGDGNNTLYLTNNGAGVLNFTVGGTTAADGNTFKNLGRLITLAGVLQVDQATTGGENGGRLNGTIQFNTISNDLGFGNGRRAIDIQVEANTSAHAGHTILIANNTVDNVAKQGVHVSLVTVSGGDIPGNNITIRDNALGATNPVGTEGGVDSGSAIEVENNHDLPNVGATHSTNLLIRNNTARNNNNSGVGSTLEINSRAVGGNNTSQINATIWANTFTNLNAGGETFEALTSAGDGTATSGICLDLNADNIAANRNTSTGGTGGFKVSANAPSGTYSIEGLPAGAQSAATVQAHLNARNNGGVTANGNFVGSNGCASSTALTEPILPKIETTAPAPAPGDTSSLAPAQVGIPQVLAQPNALAGDLTSRPFIGMPQQQQAAPAKRQTTTAKLATGNAGGVAQDDVQTAAASNKDGGIQLLQAAFPVVIPSLQPGESVTITFQVTVNSNIANNVTSVSNQGQITSTSFGGTVLTNDPSTGAANDPTVTEILPRPTYTINNASIPEPSTGSANMPFTVSLSHAYGSSVSVNFQTADGTATAAGGDYTPTSGTLTFAAGQLVQTISVPVLANGDTSDENFTMTLSNPVNSVLGATVTATGTITELNTPGRVLISEVRTSGPNGTGDDFIELYNNQDVSQNISGWAVFKTGAACTDTPVLVAVIPAATTLPPRGHYLIVGPNYNAANFNGTTGNLTAAADIEADRNLALFNTSNVSNLSTTTREDAVAFDVNAGGGFNCDLLREGATLPSAGGSASQYSFARNLITGLPKETNDSAADFLLVSTTPAVAVGNNLTPVLGAPGPENLASPIQRNAVIKASLVDGTVSKDAPPNRVRSSFGANPTNAAFGTLSIQRRFKNTLGVSVTRLRFRIVDLTTLNNRPPGASDLRVLSSTGTVTPSNGVPLPTTYTGLTLEGPPQPNGGGLNSTLTVIPPGGALAAGATIDVQFLLGVQEQGSFSFFVNVEALPAPPGAPGQLPGADLKNGSTGKQVDPATKPDDQQ